jgi:hypothetical protein
MMKRNGFIKNYERNTDTHLLKKRKEGRLFHRKKVIAFYRQSLKRKSQPMTAKGKSGSAEIFKHA